MSEFELTTLRVTEGAGRSSQYFLESKVEARALHLYLSMPGPYRRFRLDGATGTHVFQLADWVGFEVSYANLTPEEEKEAHGLCDAVPTDGELAVREREISWIS